MSYTEAQIENAIRDIMDRVDEKKERGGFAGRSLSLQTPWRDQPYQMGTVFNAETTKGEKRYVIFMMIQNGWVYYCQGDKAKKVDAKRFIDLIGSGDLEEVPRDKVDPQKKSLAVLGLMAMAHGLSFEDYMKVIWKEGDGSDVGRHV